MRTLKIAITAVGVALAAAWTSASAQNVGPAVVAIPGSFLTTYATPVTVVPQGGSLTFLNLDVAQHDVVSKQIFAEPTVTDWCCPDPDPTNPNQPVCQLQFYASHCPLFWSALAGLGGTTPVLGLENLQAGQIYDFYCTIHPGMFGKLIVLPAP